MSRFCFIFLFRRLSRFGSEPHQATSVRLQQPTPFVPHSLDLPLSGRAEAKVGKELTVQRVETLGIGLQIETIHFDHIPLVLHVRIAKGYLILERIRAYELHGLQMRMKVVHNS